LHVYILLYSVAHKRQSKRLQKQTKDVPNSGLDVEPAASILPGNTTIVAESMPPTTIFVDTSGPNPQVTGTATDTAPRLASTGTLLLTHMLFPILSQ
jgi:hypothetical protein